MSIHFSTFRALFSILCITLQLKKVKKFWGLRPLLVFELLNTLYITANKC